MISSSLIKLGETLVNKSSVKKAKVGAIAFKRGVIVNTGYNYNIYGDKTKYSVHAEEDCLAKIDGKGLSLLVISDRINSRPCEKCLALIKEKGIRRLYYFKDNELKLEYL